MPSAAHFSLHSKPRTSQHNVGHARQATIHTDPAPSQNPSEPQSASCARAHAAAWCCRARPSPAFADPAGAEQPVSRGASANAATPRAVTISTSEKAPLFSSIMCTASKPLHVRAHSAAKLNGLGRKHAPSHSLAGHGHCRANLLQQAHDDLLVEQVVCPDAMQNTLGDSYHQGCTRRG